MQVSVATCRICLDAQAGRKRKFREGVSPIGGDHPSVDLGGAKGTELERPLHVVVEFGPIARGIIGIKVEGVRVRVKSGSLSEKAQPDRVPVLASQTLRDEPQLDRRPTEPMHE